MRKVYVDIAVRMVLTIDDDTAVGDAIGEMDYDFQMPDYVNADIEDTEIIDYHVIDSK